MVHDLRFFCDAAYTLKKKLRDLGFLKKKTASYAFFRYATYAFFYTRPAAKKKSELRLFFFLQKSEVRFFRYAAYAFFDTRPTAKKKVSYTFFFQKKKPRYTFLVTRRMLISICNLLPKKQE